jgi:hypothetical protein
MAFFLFLVLAIFLAAAISFAREKIAGGFPPDPWPEEVDLSVRAPDAIPLCIDCLYPQEGRPWFCPHCRYPTGEFVTMMPYLRIFSVGEILRRGVVGPPEKGLALKAGFVLLSAQYSLFAPVYWYWMVRKSRGRPICYAQRKDLTFEELL